MFMNNEYSLLTKKLVYPKSKNISMFDQNLHWAIIPRHKIKQFQNYKKSYTLLLKSMFLWKYVCH